MSNEFFDLRDTRKEIRSRTILPQEFWQAFERGIYPPSLSDTISYHIEDFARLVEGLGYADSIYLHDYGYEINIISIQDAFHISIYPIGDKQRYLGVIDYNKSRKTHELCYREKPMDAHPIALTLINKISDELAGKGIEIDERASKSAILPFKKSFKIIICSVRLRHLIDTEPNLEPEKKLERIAPKLDIDPITVAGYGKFTTDKTVKYLAHTIYPVLMNSKYEITKKWLELIDSNPDLTLKERAERIAAELDIDPVTVAMYGSASTNERVRYEANRAKTASLESKHDITSKWRKLIDKRPDMTPQERAKSIANELGIDSITVAGYGRESTDKEVKYEAAKASIILFASKHGITARWRKLIDNNPDLTPKERAERIATEVGIESVTVAGYGRVSIDEKVKREAIKAYSTLLEVKHDITVKWRELLDNEPELEAQDRAKRLAAELGIDPITVAGYGRASADKDVKYEAHEAVTILGASKHGITARWRKLIDNNPDLTPKERVERIATELGIGPLSVAAYGRVSTIKEVKYEAIRVYNILLESKHDMTSKWRKLIDKRPDMTPQERAKSIAIELGIDPITVAGYSRVSTDKDVKYEANKALTAIAASKHGITARWRKLIDNNLDLTPKERVERIATEVGIDPISVAGYGRSSNDKEVKNEAIKVINILLESKYNVTTKWRKLMDNEPDLEPQERAKHIAAELGIRPLTIAGYGSYSADKKVKSEAYKAVYMIKKNQRNKTSSSKIAPS